MNTGSSGIFARSALNWRYVNMLNDFLVSFRLSFPNFHKLAVESLTLVFGLPSVIVVQNLFPLNETGNKSKGLPSCLYYPTQLVYIFLQFFIFIHIWSRRFAYYDYFSAVLMKGYILNSVNFWITIVLRLYWAGEGGGAMGSSLEEETKE